MEVGTENLRFFFSEPSQVRPVRCWLDPVKERPSSEIARGTRWTTGWWPMATGGGGFFLSATSDQTGCQSPTTKLRWVLEDVDCLTVLWAMFQRGAMFDKRGDFCWWSDWKAVRVVTRSKPRQKLYVLGGYQARIKNGLPDRIGYGET